jgi:hypothetical protein
MAPDDSTRCLRCRTSTKQIIDDGANPPYRLCLYCHKALAGNVTIIDSQPEEKKVGAVMRSNPRATRAFWKKRREVKGR